jgi:hypothetical protein
LGTHLLDIIALRGDIDGMPIKFRCQHCRQLLGISRQKAGDVVDCPQCGRTLRVPRLDGRIAPLPEPEWDLKDSNLARALDELASIGHEPDDVPDSAPLDDPAVAVATPVLAPPPPRVAVEAPLPAVPVSAPQPVRTFAATPSDGSLDKALAVLAAAPAADAIRTAAMTPATMTRTSPAVSQPRQLVTFVVLAAVSFAFGYVVGSRSNATAPESPTAAKNSGDGRAAQAPATNGADPAGAKLSGRITYVTQSGDSRPDRGARVIVFPPQRAGSAKLSVVGFRAADEAADMHVAAASLKALGGALAVVGEDGTYSLAVPGPGEYQVLVLSHFQPRDSDKQMTPRLRSLLESYFDRPDQLLGSLDYNHAQVRHKGADAEIWDYSFAKQ